MRLFLTHVFQYLPCWDCQWSSWAGLPACFFFKENSGKCIEKKHFLCLLAVQPNLVFFSVWTFPRCCLCIHAASLPRSPHGTAWEKHLEVWQLRSLCIIHPRMYRKCPKTWQAAWLMPLGGGNWMNKWYSLSFCNFFGGKRGQTLAKVRRRMI